MKIAMRLLCVAVAAGCSACLAPAMYRTAHVLPAGQWDAAVAASLQQVRTDAYRTERDTVRYPTTSATYLAAAPEVSFHYGLGHDLEVGGRIGLSSLMAEVDLKYRLVGGNGSNLHIAIQPAAGGRYNGGGGSTYLTAPSVAAQGYHATLPLTVTYELGARWALSLSGFGLYTSYRDYEDNEPDIVGDVVYAGAAASLRWQIGERFYIIPSLEAQRSVWRDRGPGNVPVVTCVVAGIGLGLVARQ